MSTWRRQPFTPLDKTLSKLKLKPICDTPPLLDATLILHLLQHVLTQVTTKLLLTLQLKTFSTPCFLAQPATRQFTHDLTMEAILSALFPSP